MKTFYPQTKWINALVQANIASSGTADSFIHVSHVTKTGHAHQVNCCKHAYSTASSICGVQS